VSYTRFLYHDSLKEGTVVLYSGALGSNGPTAAMRSTRRGGWRTKAGVAVIASGFNDLLSWTYYSGATAKSCLVQRVPAGEYSNSGLASVVIDLMVSGMKSCSWDRSGLYNYGNYHTYKFETVQTGLAQSFARFWGSVPNEANVQENLGAIHGQDHADTGGGVAPAPYPAFPTWSQNHWVTVSAGTSPLSGNAFVVDGHNLKSGSVVRLRTFATSTHAHGLYQRELGQGWRMSYSNVISDSQNMSAVSWTKSGVVCRVPGYRFNGHWLSEVKQTAAGYTGNVSKALSANIVQANGPVTFLAARGKDSTRVVAKLVDVTSLSARLDVLVDFAGKIVTARSGFLSHADWFDDNTVRVLCITRTCTVAHQHRLRFYPSDENGSGTAYFSEALLSKDASVARVGAPYYEGANENQFPGTIANLAPQISSYSCTLPEKVTIDARIKVLVPDTPIPGGGGFGGSYIFQICDANTRAIRFYPGALYPVDRQLWWLHYSYSDSDLADAELSVDSLYTEASNIGSHRQPLRIVASLDLSGGQSGLMGRVAIFPGSSGLATDDQWDKAYTYKTPAVSRGRQAWVTFPDSHGFVEHFSLYSGNLSDVTCFGVATEAAASGLLSALPRILHLDYRTVAQMRKLQANSSLSHGFLDTSLAVTQGRSVHFLSSTVVCRAAQLHIPDAGNEELQIGKLWLGPYFQPQYHLDTTVSYAEKAHRFRASPFISRGGVSYLDETEPLKEYTIQPDLLDSSINAATLANYRTLLERVRNDRVFYIAFDSDWNGSTVFGYLVNDEARFTRFGKADGYTLSPLVFREQP
jgi:hypothetical protein